MLTLVRGRDIGQDFIESAPHGLPDFLLDLSQGPPGSLVSNFDAEIWALVGSGLTLPITVNHGHEKTCFVSSPSEFYVSYARDQIRRTNEGALPLWLAVLTEGSRITLKVARADRIVCVNNWPVWTAPYPAWDGRNIEQVTACIVDAFPDHLVCFRSLNRTFHADLLDSLGRAGYLLVAADHAFVCDYRSAQPEKPRKLRRDLKRDLKLLEKLDNYTHVCHEDISSDDINRISQIYDLLNIQKHTSHNPQYTVELFRSIFQTKVARFSALRSDSGVIDAVACNVLLGGVLTNLFVGYDTGAGKDKNLFRLLHAMIFREAMDGGYGLNLGTAAGGAAEFKRLRGAEPTLEFNAYFVRHLPWLTRTLMASFKSSMDRIGVAVMNRYDF